jgi:hypothetical protein
MGSNQHGIAVALRLCAALAWFGFVGITHAQSPTWSKVAEFAGTTTEINVSSIEPFSSKGRIVKFQWRRVDSLNVMTTVSVASCNSFEMTNLTGISEGKISPSRKEFSYDTSPIYKQSRVVYGRVSRLDGPGAVIRAACLQVYPDRVKELEEPSVDCTAMKSPVDRLYCRKDPELSATIELFAERTFLLPEVCGYEESQAEAVLLYFMGQASHCDSIGCEKSKVASGLELISSDLANVKNEARSCSSLTQVAKWADESRQKELSDAAFKRYVACTRSATSRLDDGVSSAEVIARGLHGSCIEPFNESLRLSPTLKGSGGAEMYREIEPQLVQMVLEGRAGRRKTTKSK